jgi:hypothetical protein
MVFQKVEIVFNLKPATTLKMEIWRIDIWGQQGQNISKTLSLSTGRGGTHLSFKL